MFGVCITAVGSRLPSYFKHTLPSVVQYCQRHSYSLSIIDTPPYDKRPAAWQKLLAFHVVPKDVSHVLMLDMDVFIMPEAEPIHKYVDWDSVNLRREDDHWQTGVMVVPREHREWLEGVYENSNWKKCGTWYEQQPVSDSIDSGDVPVIELDTKWNWIPNGTIRSMMIRRGDVQFVHCAGNGKKQIERKYTHLKKCFENYFNV